MPSPDLDSVLEVYPEDNRDVLYPNIDPSILLLHSADLEATRKHQLEYVLAKHVQEIDNWRSEFESFLNTDAIDVQQAADVTPIRWHPNKLFDGRLKRSRRSVPVIDWETNVTARLFRESSLKRLRQWLQSSAEWVEDIAGAGQAEKHSQAQDLNELYEKQYAQLRHEQEFELEVMLSRQWVLGHHMLRNLPFLDYKMWTSVAWEGSLMEIKQGGVCQAHGNVQLFGRTPHNLHFPMGISISRVVGFDNIREYNNTKFIQKWCNEANPKYILRATSDNNSDSLPRLVEQSWISPRAGAQVCDLDLDSQTEQPRRQLVLVPLCFVQAPLHSHPNLKKLLDRPSHSFLAILRNAPKLGDDEEIDCWNFDPLTNLSIPHLPPEPNIPSPNKTGRPPLPPPVGQSQSSAPATGPDHRPHLPPLDLSGLSFVSQPTTLMPGTANYTYPSPLVASSSTSYFSNDLIPRSAKAAEATLGSSQLPAVTPQQQELTNLFTMFVQRSAQQQQPRMEQQDQNNQQQQQVEGQAQNSVSEVVEALARLRGQGGLGETIPKGPPRDPRLPPE